MTYYSREVKKPNTMKEGLCNFVQMIVNQIEAGEHREALLKAVDLLDTLSGKANPYASVTDGAPVENSILETIKAAHVRELAAEFEHGKNAGWNEGVAAAKRDIAMKLGLL